ncbi:MAG TPA: DUF3137 domain-containing protein [Actinomycetota bacterium]|nr:DUF3137 domain-containing protein [Actinomycetota bacterium]
MEVLPFVLFAVVAVAVLIGGYILKQRRREAFRAFALHHGLEFSVGDPFGLLDRPFSLFRRGDGRGIENVAHGPWKGEPVLAFDYWYYTEHQNSKGGRTRSYRRFSCVLVEVPAAFPHLEIGREGVFTRLADHLGMEDIEFESPEFNRRYNVKADNRRFAFELLDARMLEWLVGFDQGLAFEVLGNRVLAYGGRRKPHLLMPMIETARMFRDRIPRVARNLYPLAG